MTLRIVRPGVYKTSRRAAIATSTYVSYSITKG
jgi:hypothetical protein